MLRTTLEALPLNPEATDQEKAAQRQAALLDLQHLAPSDPVQARLAARSISAHYLARECMRRAIQPGLPDSLALRFQSKAVALDRMSSEAHRQLVKLQALERNKEPAVAAPTPEPARQQRPDPAPLAAKPRPPQAQPVRQDPLQREKPKHPAPAAPLSSQQEQALLQQWMNDMFDRSSISIPALAAGLPSIPHGK